jgi:hypothetical protein
MINLPLWTNYNPLNAEKIYSDSKEMEKWCNENIPGDDAWHFYSDSPEGVRYRSLFGFSVAVRTHIRFLNDEDATAFKIRFKL